MVVPSRDDKIHVLSMHESRKKKIKITCNLTNSMRVGKPMGVLELRKKKFKEIFN